MLTFANVILIHGAYGYPEENWFGWLQEELRQSNIACYIPQLPTPEFQHITIWSKVFDQTCCDLIHSQTVFIGHSLGAAFLLHWLQRHEVSVAAVVLVGAFIGEVGNPDFDTINRNFFTDSFCWHLIKQRSTNFISYWGDNDPYVTRENFDFIAENLGAKKIIISNAGHLNTAAGFSQFPHLLWQLNNIFED